MLLARRSAARQCPWLRIVVQKMCGHGEAQLKGLQRCHSMRNSPCYMMRNIHSRSMPVNQVKVDLHRQETRENHCFACLTYLRKCMQDSFHCAVCAIRHMLLGAGAMLAPIQVGALLSGGLELVLLALLPMLWWVVHDAQLSPDCLHLFMCCQPRYMRTCCKSFL